MKGPPTLDHTADVEAYRAQVRSFLAMHLPPGWRGIGALTPVERRSFEAGWIKVLEANQLRAPEWPSAYGGAGLDPQHRVALVEEFASAGAPMSTFVDVFGIEMLGPTIIEWGTDAQKKFFLPRILSGEHVWCQGFSEPGAGSDLAGVTTTARLEGDEWVINGQKLWTSSAHVADWIFLLCRTGSEGAPHARLTLLLCPMEQAGIEIRPVGMMNGESEFNEVFFTDARTAAENVLGGVNNGWNVALTLLGHERGGRASTAVHVYAAELVRVVAAARERGLTSDPLVRSQLARVYSHVEVIRYMGHGIVHRFLAGLDTTVDAAMFKLFVTECHKQVTELSVHVLGAEAMAPQGDIPPNAIPTDLPGGATSSAAFVQIFLNSRAGTIYGGTSEVQRNIIGERGLGLPKEPSRRTDGNR